MNDKEFAELSAGHALNALSAEDEARYEQALREHPEWAARAAQDADTAMLMADAGGEVTPPPALRASILDAIAQQPQGAADVEVTHAVEAAPVADAAAEATPVADVADATEPAPAAETVVPAAEASADEEPVVATVAEKPKTLSRKMLALAACIVLVVAVGVGVTVTALNQPKAVVTAEQALEQISDAGDAKRADGSTEDGAALTAYWSESAATAALVTANLPSLDEAKTYEIWVIRGDAAPVSAGLFSARAGETAAVITHALHDGDVVAITEEVAGGAPDGKPTTDPIASITISA